MKTNSKPIGYSTVASLGVVAMLMVMSGCQRDVRLADSKLRHVEVKTVQRYGITLDKDATPKQVAYVLLRAMFEDLHAKDSSARDKVLDTQFAICAADEIVAASLSSLKREEVIYRLVYRWTPTVSYYINSFPATWKETEERSTQTRVRPAKFSASAANMCEVFLPVTGAEGANAVVSMILIQDQGFWRVFQVACIPGQFKSAKAVATKSSSQ